MFDELKEVVKEFLKKLFSSRLFALAVIFTLMYAGLIGKLFNLQIIHGDEYQQSYMQRTEKMVTAPGTRGNIYDRNGKLLAYNELAYSVMESAPKSWMMPAAVILRTLQQEKPLS